MEVSQTSNVFRSHHAGGIQKATITSQTSLDLCTFEANSFGEITCFITTPSFPKSSVFKIFPSTRKREAGIFRFLWFECFQKASLSCGW